MNSHEMRTECNDWLFALLGAELAVQWWDQPNRAFDGLTPEAVWQTEPNRIYQYLAHAGNTEG